MNLDMLLRKNMVFLVVVQVDNAIPVWRELSLLKTFYADPRSGFPDNVKQRRLQPQVLRDTHFRTWLQEVDAEENVIVPKAGFVSIKDNGRVLRWLIYAEPLKLTTVDRRGLKQKVESPKHGSALTD